MKKPRVRKNDAPKGYIAVRDESLEGCEGCAFENYRLCNRRCNSRERLDSCNVIFKKASRKAG